VSGCVHSYILSQRAALYHYCTPSQMLPPHTHTHIHIHTATPSRYSTSPTPPPWPPWGPSPTSSALAPVGVRARALPDNNNSSSAHVKKIEARIVLIVFLQPPFERPCKQTALKQIRRALLEDFLPTMKESATVFAATKAIKLMRDALAKVSGIYVDELVAGLTKHMLVD
jgi:hypothetical protein